MTTCLTAPLSNCACEVLAGFGNVGRSIWLCPDGLNDQPIFEHLLEEIQPPERLFSNILISDFFNLGLPSHPSNGQAASGEAA